MEFIFITHKRILSIILIYDSRNMNNYEAYLMERNANNLEDFQDFGTIALNQERGVTI